MRQQFPLVSVIIPTYNRPNYLRESLESVVNQSYINIEVIVVDDGTPNNEVFNICKEFENIVYLKIENSGGPAKPRNIGIKEARGKYIAFLDDDDLWIKTKIEQQLNILEENLEFGLVHGYCNLIDESGVTIGGIIGKPGSPEVKHGDVSMRMIGNWTLMTSSVFIRKELIDLVGLFNEKMPPAGEDLEYWVRCSFFTQFYNLDKVLVNYRVHELNISKQKTEYINLPLHLKGVLDFNIKNKIIDIIFFHILISNICRMQLKMIKLNPVLVLSNLFKLQPFWFLKYQYLKLLIYIIIKK